MEQHLISFRWAPLNPGGAPPRSVSRLVTTAWSAYTSPSSKPGKNDSLGTWDRASSTAGAKGTPTWARLATTPRTMASRKVCADGVVVLVMVPVSLSDHVGWR